MEKKSQMNTDRHGFHELTRISLFKNPLVAIRAIRVCNLCSSKPYPCSEKKRSPSPRPSPPGRGRSYCLSLEHSLNGDPCGRRQWVLPLLGERAGVRASLISYCINTA